MDKIKDVLLSVIDRIRSTLNQMRKWLINQKRQITRSVRSGSAVSRPDRAVKARPIKRHGRQRVYRLKGYTTVAKINRKRQSERQQRLLRRILIFIVFILVLILLFNLYNPIRDLSEWYRIIGIEDLSELTKDNPLSSTNTENPTITKSLTKAVSPAQTTGSTGQ